MAPGETRTATFQLRRKDVSLWSTERQLWYVPEGAIQLYVGASSMKLPLVRIHRDYHTKAAADGGYTLGGLVVFNYIVISTLRLNARNTSSLSTGIRVISEDEEWALILISMVRSAACAYAFYTSLPYR